ncbi:AAA family ATPase [Cetobacterium sp.]|uniref:AAA family ATPase n=1 Tax=Cetobacterium sp. TaxID=2071632 RepID=UPI003EE4798F
MVKKKLPVGIDSFKKIIENDYYFVDKTMFIDEYDTPLVTAHSQGYYDEAIFFFRNVLSAALKYYELDYELEEIKKWYNGYKFGDKLVYNPWSIINCINNKEINSYRINTSDNALRIVSLKNIVMEKQLCILKCLRICI